MRRIPESLLARLRADVSVERLVAAHGVDLQKHGTNDLVGQCPFHDDRTPSLVVTPSKNLWHCLGACDAGGGPIDWVMRAEDVSFRHAVEILRSQLALDAGEQGPAKVLTTLPMLVEPDQGDQELLGRVVRFYHRTLLKSPRAFAYLEERGIRDEEAIERFQLGYANRSLHYRLPDKDTADGRKVRKRLRALGVVRKSGHEHLNGSLVIPVFTPQGEITEMYGRRVDNQRRTGKVYHSYLKGPHRGVWNAAELKDAEEIILCESLIDGLTFWVHGFRNVTASYGTSGFTADHRALFERLSKGRLRRVLIAYDRDEAGESAAQQLASELASGGLSVFRVQFPHGMDANEYALQLKPAAKSLDLALRKSIWLAGVRSVAANELEPEDVSSEKSTGYESSVLAAKREGGPSGEDERGSSELAKPSLVSAAKKESPRGPGSELPGGVSGQRPGPAEPGSDIQVERRDHQVEITLGDRRYRIRGLEKNHSHSVLKVNLFVGRGAAFHVDTLDLYMARPRSSYINQAGRELRLDDTVIKADLKRVLFELEKIRDAQIEEALEPEKTEVVVGDRDRAEAMELLQSPDLLSRILEDFERAGVVGEESNKLIGYLAGVSRKLKTPLAVIIQSSSAAGKTSLMDAVLGLMPEEEQVKYSAMTGQSLFYMGNADLKQKILAIVEEEGAERASYALKLLQSEGELTIASTGKDPTTGMLETQEYRVEGPVAIFLTTTALEVDEELQNRCLVLTVDENRSQTRAIHEQQRLGETIDGLLARRSKRAIMHLHQNAQRLLKPMLVSNSYAEHLTFLDSRTRTRRDHMKYLTLIRTVALLHQYQRETKTVRDGGQNVEYIEVTIDDIEVANRLMHEVLGRSLDELSPQTRRLLIMLTEMVNEACVRDELSRRDYRFTRRSAREYTGWSYKQVRTHLDRLVELEYVIVHHGGRGQRFVYELLFDGGDNSRPHFSGLIDVAQLRLDEDSPRTNRSLPIALGSLPENLAHFDPSLPPPFPGFAQRAEVRKPRPQLRSSETLPSSTENAHLGPVNGNDPRTL